MVETTFYKVNGTQRVLTADDTFERVKDAARCLGVTRLADISGLDHVGIPIYSAVVPRSDDTLSVYAGKGLQVIEAKVGALMEAIERQTALKARLPVVEGSFEQLKREYLVLDPREIKETLCPNYSQTAVYSWVFGQDIISDCEILVPAKYAGYIWNDVPHRSCFAFSTTNGLASGNVREEAICHALCELIERDAWTLAEIGAHLIPWARRRLVDPGNAENGPDDFEMFSCLRLDGDPVYDLFQRAELQPMLHDITSDVGIPTIFAAVQDERIPGFPMVHGGLGSHPDARVAARRALTEAAQSRCVDIQGVREDMEPAGSVPSTINLHTRRISTVNRKQWILGQSSIYRSLDDLSSAVYETINKDIKHLLSRLELVGIDQVIVVDLSPPGASFAVVRVIVPGLETWSISRGPIGHRAFDFWRSHV